LWIGRPLSSPVSFSFWKSFACPTDISFFPRYQIELSKFPQVVLTPNLLRTIDEENVPESEILIVTLCESLNAARYAAQTSVRAFISKSKRKQ
jgi:hypothetical protein